MRPKSSSRMGICVAEVRSLLEFIQAQQEGKHGRSPRTLEKIMTRLACGGGRGRPSGTAPRPDLGTDPRGRSWSRSPTHDRTGSERADEDGHPRGGRLPRKLLNEVDAVSIAVPTFMHREVAGDFLARGIATLVEKPLASSSAEAEELVALGPGPPSDGASQVGHVERFNPALSAPRRPGRMRPVRSRRSGSRPTRFAPADIGVVLDLMISRHRPRLPARTRG